MGHYALWQDLLTAENAKKRKVISSRCSALSSVNLFSMERLWKKKALRQPFCYLNLINGMIAAKTQKYSTLNTANMEGVRELVQEVMCAGYPGCSYGYFFGHAVFDDRCQLVHF
jgi:hypothetical protein